MNRALWRASWRYLARHLGSTLLMVLGVALGVAVVVAIDLANSAANRAFDLSTATIAGRATHQIIGGPRGLDEQVYARLRTAGVEQAAPVVSGYFTSPQLGGRPIQLLGVDPFAEAPFRDYLNTTAAGSVSVAQLTTLLTRPGALLISEGMAQEYGLRVGQTIDLHAAGRPATATIVGLLQPRDALSRRALDGLALADIATGQELLGQVGRLDHIDLILPANDPVREAAVRALLPADVQLLTAGATADTVSQMAAAFRTNLTALSLLALVVGMFLIYNSMTFAVVQRRGLFGTLRCLGVTRGELARQVLAEAALVGLAGSALGLALGVLLGQGAVRLVTQTINDLYYTVSVRGVTVPVGSLVKGALLGLFTTLGSAALPAWEAAAVPPRLALSRASVEEGARRAVPLTAAAGAALLLAGAGTLAVPTRSLVISFAGIFLVTVGFALLAPLVTRVLLTWAMPGLRRVFGVLGRMAPRSVTAALSRTAVAIAALMVAVSVTIGVGLMVQSFRATVVTWLGQTLRSDIYISAPDVTATRPTVPLEAQVVEVAGHWPGVVRSDTLRSATVLSPAGPIAVSAVSAGDFTATRIFVRRAGDAAAVAAAVQNGAVIVSEPLANRLNLPAEGAGVTLITDHGPHVFPVAGVYRDYASSQGTVTMALPLYRQYWNDPALSAVSLDLAPGQNPDAVAKALSARLAGVQELQVRANRALRADVMQVFDQAFAITNALQLLAAIVAFIGVLAALLSLQLERSRELGVLTALGMTGRQLRGVVLLETGLMGTVAGLLAMPMGLTLALILIYIINRRSFGWTLQLQAGPGVFVQALLLAVLAALLAGIYPAVKMGRALAAEALRSE